MATQKDFIDVGINESIKDAIQTFVDCVEIRDLKSRLINIVFHFFIGQLRGGRMFDLTDIEIFLDLKELFDFLLILEEEFEGD